MSESETIDPKRLIEILHSEDKPEGHIVVRVLLGEEGCAGNYREVATVSLTLLRKMLEVQLDEKSG